MEMGNGKGGNAIYQDLGVNMFYLPYAGKVRASIL